VLDGAGAGRGLTVDAAVVPGAPPVYRLALSNASLTPLDGFMLQFNKNAAGLAPAAQAVAAPPVPPGGAAVTVDVPLTVSPALVAPGGGSKLQVAIRCTQLGVFYFDDVLPAGGL
jgi:AP-1 complex subunit beta-1